ncbi:MAG TPA: hypothetical protein VK862_18050, partial [Afifellaceae bacterium]|nr:hypothetical protein [Afifellaceae bacterium]
DRSFLPPITQITLKVSPLPLSIRNRQCTDKAASANSPGYQGNLEYVCARRYITAEIPEIDEEAPWRA